MIPFENKGHVSHSLIRLLNIIKLFDGCLCGLSCALSVFDTINDRRYGLFSCYCHFDYGRRGRECSRLNDRRIGTKAEGKNKGNLGEEKGE